MSTVFLHVGQCGNQVGQSFWRIVNKDEQVVGSHTFQHADGKQRSVHVDSEPKVIQKVCKGSKIREGNVVCGKRGRGTNWALGYYGNRHAGDDHLLDETLDKMRKEIERCDAYSGCVVMHSLSGGTGSGLGSKLCEELREEYPMSHLVSCTFAPCESGESPLQNYNSLLTLNKLCRNTDGIILIYNDDVLENLQRKLESVSFGKMNDNIAASLCGLFLPTDTLVPNNGVSIGMEPWELIRSVSPMPSTKFIHVSHVARSQQTWEGIIGQVLLKVRQYNRKGTSYGSLNNLVVARGDSTQTFYSAMKSLEKKVKSVCRCVEWNPFPVDVWTARACIPGKSTASVTLASNHGTVLQYLEMVKEHAAVKYENSAYLHWYWRHGASQCCKFPIVLSPYCCWELGFLVYQSANQWILRLLAGLTKWNRWTLRNRLKLYQKL